MPEPILAVRGKIGVEPGRDGHHVRASVEAGHIGLVIGSGEIVVTLGPGTPRSEAINVAGRGDRA